MKGETFTADRLLALHDRVAEAEDAIPRLRRFVLDLAVRGKLVEQDPSDEPAAELLKRLGKGRVAAPDMPTNWLSAKLGEVIDLQYGKGLDKKLRLDEGPVPVFGSNGIVCFTEEPLTAQPSIIVGRKGSAGALNICDGPSWTTDVAYFVELPSFLSLRYLFNLLSSLGLDGLGKGVKPGLSRSDAYVLSVSVPPLAEQRRIVAKVDELMALCDRLQAARAGREAVRDRLTAATLARLTAPETDAETFPTHARFALQTLPTLTTREGQIKTLRQTILNLAVRGKLVEQDPTDEPAAELLKRIAKEHQNSGKPGSALTSVDDELFALPAGWAWTPFGNLVLSSDAGWSPKTLDHPRQEGEWGVLKVSAVSWDHFDASANKQVTPGTEPRLQAQVHQGDFLISRANTAELIARAVLVREKPDRLMMSDKIVRLRLTELTSPEYLWAVNNYADFAREHYFSRATGVSPSMKNVSRDVILNLPIPLPPLAEQHRIVAKVDALMALCDQLEASLTTATTTRSRLLEALLHEALGGAPGDQAEAAA